MLNCRPCNRRYIRILIQDVLATSSSRSLNIPLRPPCVRSPSLLRRSYASTSTAAQKFNGPQKKPPIGASEVFSTTSLERELRFLGDPLKLAGHIRDLLRKDQHEKAAELVKMSSKNVGCTVSWNHLIDDAFQKGKVQYALKLYNDMKKRAQLPDAQTFTILFRGLSWHPEYTKSLERALALYQSMNTSNCPVKPSIIHTNALLRVCARSRDIDALLGVAAKLPTRGPGASDHVTYTTILNAIHREAWTTGDDGGDAKLSAERQQRANLQGRRLWGEIVERMRKGDLRMDERLVGAMGRILLLGGSENDCQDVLSLVEQTMGIQRPVARAVARSKVRDPGLDAPEASDLALQEPVLSPESVSTSRELPDDETPGGEFNPLPNSKSKPFALAGPVTLSLVVDACVRLRAITWAQSYWGVLTDPAGRYKIAPDAENHHMYLRLLRVQRASKLAVELVNEMRQGKDGSASIQLEIKTFRIAMSTCVRDSKNPNVRENADKLARMMLDTLEVPDIKVLEMYVDVASNQNHFDWKTMMGMLRGTVLGVRNLRSLLAYKPTSGQGFGRDQGVAQNQKVSRKKRQDPKDLGTNQQPTWKEVTGLATKLISAYDFAMNIAGEAMNPEDRADCEKHKKILSSWVTRAHYIEKTKRNRNVPSMTSSTNPSTDTNDHELASFYPRVRPQAPTPKVLSPRILPLDTSKVGRESIGSNW